MTDTLSIFLARTTSRAAGNRGIVIVAGILPIGLNRVLLPFLLPSFGVICGLRDPRGPRADITVITIIVGEPLFARSISPRDCDRRILMKDVSDLREKSRSILSAFFSLSLSLS